MGVFALALKPELLPRFLQRLGVYHSNCWDPPTGQNVGHDVLHGPRTADADHDAVVLGVVRDEPRRAAHATRHSSGHSSHVGVRAVDEGSPKISKDRLECYLSLFAHTKPTFSWL